MKSLTSLPKFLAIEGVDGVGKTELARRLQNDLGYHYAYTLPEPFRKIKNEVDDLQFPAARFFYYLTCVVTFQRQLTILLQQGCRIVVDRYIYSTLAMHQAMEVSAKCINIDSLPILFPDMTILLTCASLERNRRLTQRGLENADYVKMYGPVLDKAQQYFEDFSLMHIIDTTFMTTKMVFTKTIELIHQELP